MHFYDQHCQQPLTRPDHASVPQSYKVNSYLPHNYL